MTQQHNTPDDVTIEEMDPTWMVAYRTFMMPGGVITFGMAEIVGFYDSFEKADSKAKTVFERNKGELDLHVWILRCEKTYCNAGIAIERGACHDH